jgi:hypothetical protein
VVQKPVKHRTDYSRLVAQQFAQSSTGRLDVSSVLAPSLGRALSLSWMRHCKTAGREALCSVLQLGNG